MTRLDVLATSDYYLPGYKSGGSLRSISNLVERLGDRIRFRIVAGDRDRGDDGPYPGIRTERWEEVGKALVYYVPRRRGSLGFWRRMLNDTAHDVLYLNSFHSPRFTLAPLLVRRLGMAPSVPVILAPRGEFSPGALAIKSRKKRLYRTVALSMGLYDGVRWHCSSEFEKRDILQTLGKERADKGDFRIADDFPGSPPAEALPPRGEKEPGRLRLVFLSRLSRNKNLDGALRSLAGLRGEIDFDVYGPAEDPAYLGECEGIVSGLPENVRVRFRGPVPHEEVLSVLSRYQFFLFPSHGENYGHVIVEAMSAGLPPILSDRTPWRGLEEKGVGWDLPPERTGEFREVLQRCADMGPGEYAALSAGAFRYSRSVGGSDLPMERNLELFFAGYGGSSPKR